MSDVLFEQKIIQNAALGAECLWQAIHEAYEVRVRTEGVSLPLIFVVLPLVFHKRTARALEGKAKPGALYKALADDREILIGLQRRMQSLADRTLQGLSLALDSKMLLLDSDAEMRLVPGLKNAPVLHSSAEVKTILSAAKRVGQGLGEMSAFQLTTHLQITF